MDANTPLGAYNAFGVIVGTLSFASQGLPSIPNVVSGPVSPSSLASGQSTNQQSLVDGFLQSSNFKTGSVGWQILANGDVEFGSGKFRGDITGATGTFSGTLTGGSLNIPDTTTANSFHVDTTGNAWWGSNVASGISASTASVKNDGTAVFKNVSVGGSILQYVITNSGIFSFGDGSDGTVTISVDTTLTRDMYYDVLVVNSGINLNCGGYRIFAKTSATVNGHVHRDGSTGNGGGTRPFPDANVNNGGAASTLSDGYLKGSGPSGAGGNSGGDGGSGLNASAASGVSNCINSSNGSSGQSGGNGTGIYTGGTGAAGITVVPSNVKLIANWHLATLLDVSSSGSTVKFTSSAGGSGGGGGGGGGAGSFCTGGGGGSGGQGGGLVAIYAKSLTIGATGSITSNGGKGGDGGDGGANGATKAGNGGGGSGGNGGSIVLVFNVLVNSGTITVTAGIGGQGGGNGGTGKTAANSGSNGIIYQFQLSL